MNSKKQEEMIDSYLSLLDGDRRPLYWDIIGCLAELGYHPQKERDHLSFKHTLHNKQMAKMGMKKGKAAVPFIALRFSACKGYSQRFADIVSSNIIKNPSKVPGCTVHACSFCAGEPDTHVYSYTFPDGVSKSHCGAYALEIPDITANDLTEIKKLIREEHDYLIKHEAHSSPCVK
jgi:hypothetical protein